MMFWRTALTLGLVAFSPLSSSYAEHTPEHTAKVGGAVPDFTVKDSTGKTHVFSKDLKGKVIVLEWTNKDCPFAGKKYYPQDDNKDSKERTRIPDAQKKYKEKGVVWLTVISSAKGKQGYLDPANPKDKAVLDTMYANGSAVIIDDSGALAKQFGATVTTTIAIIDKEGKLVYFGAFDSMDNANKAYTQEALDAVLEGKPIATAETKAVGCSVKFAD